MHSIEKLSVLLSQTLDVDDEPITMTSGDVTVTSSRVSTGYVSSLQLTAGADNDTVRAVLPEDLQIDTTLDSVLLSVSFLSLPVILFIFVIKADFYVLISCF